MGAGTGVTFSDVSFCYPGQDSEALGPLALSIRPGEVISIVGPSGCGKSTLLKLASGLLKPTLGDVSLSGNKVVGLAPQAPTLLPWLNVVQNVSLPAELGRVPHLDRFEVDELVAAVGLRKWRHAMPDTLSGGMQSRAALARALCGSPTLLLLDEPLGSLDEITAEAILLDVATLLARTRPTTMFVSHNLFQAAFLADRVVAMSARPGKILGVVETKLPRERTVDTLTSSALAFAVASTRALLTRAPA